jgi:hypothetical protein
MTASDIGYDHIHTWIKPILRPVHAIVRGTITRALRTPCRGVPRCLQPRPLLLHQHQTHGLSSTGPRTALAPLDGACHRSVPLGAHARMSDTPPLQTVTSDHCISRDESIAELG